MVFGIVKSTRYIFVIVLCEICKQNSNFIQFGLLSSSIYPKSSQENIYCSHFVVTRICLDFHKKYRYSLLLIVFYLINEITHFRLSLG